MDAAVVEKDQEMYERCEAVRQNFIEDWEKIVNIDSPTGFVEGLIQVGNIVIDKLKSLGAQIDIYSAGDNAGFHMAGTLNGTGNNSVLILAHMDTVFPVGSAVKRPFYIDSDQKAHGPGVMDCKAGLVAALHAMEIVQAIASDKYSKLTLFSNNDEEDDSLTSREIVMKLSKEHDYVLCLEAGRPGDQIVVCRGGNGVLEIEVKGLSAHGATPEVGRNAAEELAHLILELKKLEDVEKNTFITTRIIESGTENRSNTVVPDYATGLVRVGTYCSDELNRVLKSVEELKKNPFVPGAEVNIQFKLGAYAFSRTKQTEQMAELACAIYAGLGKELKFLETRMSADANFAAVTNTAILDGLSIVGGDVHSEQEWTDVNTLVPRLYLLSKLVTELGSRTVVK